MHVFVFFFLFAYWCVCLLDSSTQSFAIGLMFLCVLTCGSIIGGLGQVDVGVDVAHRFVDRQQRRQGLQDRQQHQRGLQRRQQQQQQQQRQHAPLGLLMREGIIPVVIFLVFAFLFSDSAKMSLFG